MILIMNVSQDAIKHLLYALCSSFLSCIISEQVKTEPPSEFPKICIYTLLYTASLCWGERRPNFAMQSDQVSVNFSSQIFRCLMSESTCTYFAVCAAKDSFHHIRNSVQRVPNVVDVNKDTFQKTAGKEMRHEENSRMEEGRLASRSLKCPNQAGMFFHIIYEPKD